MKKLIISTIAILGLLVFTSCEDSVGPTINSDGSSPALTSHSGGESFVLNEEEADDELFTLSWDAPDYGFSAAVTYTIQMDADNSGFENPVTFAETTQTSITMTVGEVNAILLDAGLPFSEETTVDMRIRAHVNDSVEDRYSDVFTLGFTPYETEVDVTFPEELFMIGNSVGGWDWGAVDLPMIPVYDKPHLFWKIVWIEAGVDDPGYKFAPEQDWGNDFGYNGEAPVDGVVEFGGDNMPEPEESGYYMVVVNYETEEIAVVDPQVYLIGETVGSWDTANQDARFDVDNENELLTITRELNSEELRMYAWYDGGWFTDWWQSEFMIFGGEIEFRGTGGDQDRVNISPAGEYTIELDFRNNTGSVQQQ
ncbi:SusF/SusE family outer membrane protein [Rhodohalobacter sp. SW132]|uniref:SusE domain-containing protein n=1 Tax=Rhodohalobacter sp. SW132 TaxID=2293433 RepID=UPI000E23B98B|nr:SusE domain-containing protein [Rhodohalobacter sp. SW132]REL38290.1 SusF/SusE family outer membrane protein [Rhodohalobacter sp. SW132]